MEARIRIKRWFHYGVSGFIVPETSSEKWNAEDAKDAEENWDKQPRKTGNNISNLDYSSDPLGTGRMSCVYGGRAGL
jgi:hypothetical protein